jgi:hypothetical protein
VVENQHPKSSLSLKVCTKDKSLIIIEVIRDKYQLAV